MLRRRDVQTLCRIAAVFRVERVRIVLAVPEYEHMPMIVRTAQIHARLVGFRQHFEPPFAVHRGGVGLGITRVRRVETVVEAAGQRIGLVEHAVPEYAGKLARQRTLANAVAQIHADLRRPAYI